MTRYIPSGSKSTPGPVSKVNTFYVKLDKSYYIFVEIIMQNADICTQFIINMFLTF